MTQSLASLIPQVPDYLAARNQASGRVAEKLSMKRPMPVKPSSGAAAIEGGLGGLMVANSLAGAMGGGTPTKAPAEGLMPKGPDMGAVTPAQADAALSAPVKTPMAGQAKPAPGVFSSFFNFFT